MNLDDILRDYEKKGESPTSPPEKKVSPAEAWEVTHSREQVSRAEDAQAERAKEQDAPARDAPAAELIADFAGKRVVLTEPGVAPAVLTSEMRPRIRRPGKPGFLVIARDGTLYFEPDGAEAVPILSGGVAGLGDEAQNLLEHRARVLCLMRRDEDSGEYVFDFPRAADFRPGVIRGSDAVRRLAGQVKSRVSGLRETRADE